MSKVDQLKRALAEKVERDAVIDNRIQDELKRQEAKDAAHIEIRAREDLDAWAMCFQPNLNLLSGDRHIELHYKAAIQVDKSGSIQPCARYFAKGYL